MPYKIVETIERGEIKLTTIPDNWEKNGILYWPETAKLKKKRKIEDSLPDYKKWIKIDCVVKRRDIPTFYQAEDEIDAMSNNSETETDIENQPPNIIKRLPLKNFNSMIEVASTSSISLPYLNKAQSTDHDQCIAPGKQPINPDALTINQGTSEAKTNDLPIIHINEKDLLYEPVLLQDELKENEYVQSNPILDEIKSLQNEIETVKNSIQTVTENQNVLSNNQNTIIAQISELSIKLEEFIKMTLTVKKNPDDFHVTKAVKIKNVNTLEEFERKLDQSDSRDELYRQYSVILSQGVGKGTTNAYTLVDAIFDRKFFMQCSWTGMSKGDGTKICFKAFTKTINFFFDIVHESDNTFTKAQLAIFFKTILRNARYRSQNDQVRMSSQRQKQITKRKSTKSLPTSLADNLEKPPSEQNQRDLDSETKLCSEKAN